MKKLTLMIIVALALVTGCGKDDNPTAPKVTCTPEVGAPRELAEFWLYVEAVVDKNPVPLAEALDWEYGSEVAVMLIETDGYFGYAEFDGDGELTHLAEGSIKTDGSCFSVSAGGESYDGSWSITRDELVFNTKINGKAAMLRAVRVELNASVQMKSLMR